MTTATKRKTAAKAAAKIVTRRTLVVPGEIENLGGLRALVRAADEAGFTDESSIEWDDYFGDGKYATSVTEVAG